MSRFDLLTYVGAAGMPIAVAPLASDPPARRSAAEGATIALKLE